jgi:hypothetical protein
VQNGDSYLCPPEQYLSKNNDKKERCFHRINSQCTLCTLAFFVARFVDVVKSVRLLTFVSLF